jgi:hypothetical protein
MTEARRCIASYASESDYAPLARHLLWKLGYELRPPEEAPVPELRIVHEERFGDVPRFPAVPIILLTSRRRARVRDERIVGLVRRPAGPHELHQLIQAALEEHPRSSLRVPTSLRAWGRSEDDQWELTVESLSEQGCLVAGSKLPQLDTLLQIEIELPWGPRVRAPALATYEQGERLGLVFHGITLEGQGHIRKAVVSLLDRL